MTEKPAFAPDPLRHVAEVMHEIRDRCVWTQQMSHEKLLPYLIEESAELIDAVESGDRTELREELGDLLWQVVFHAELASRDETDPFTIDDVAQGVTEKMVRRHPHVFGDATAETTDQVWELWNAAKAGEKHTRTSVLDGVSHAMPALSLAHKVLAKAEQVQVGEELAVAAHEANLAEASPTTEAELGEVLLTLVAVARTRGWDAERALRGAVRDVEAEVREEEARGRAETTDR